MRAINQLVHSRTRVRSRYALMPLEGFPPSRLPVWPDCEARILAAPALGAGFSQHLMDIPTGKGVKQGDALWQSFGYVLNGAANVMVDGDKMILPPGGYFFVPEKSEWSLTATEPAKIILVNKRFEHNGFYKATMPESILALASDVPSTPFGGNEHARLQTLLPDTIAYDMAINIFTFDPGHGLPIVETHVMEHGLYFLEGKGVYYLDDTWMEVEKDDFIWMGPFCPQSFYATGPTPAKYLYYKNVNREIAL